MTIAQGQKILAADYNYIAQIVKDILGVGSGTSGYGQQTLTTLITGTPIISHTDWTNLRADMSLVRLHQSGIAIGSEGNNLPTPVAGASITGTDAAAFNSFVQTIYNDRYKVSFNQLTTNGSTTDTSIGPWNGTKTYTYTFTGDTTGSGSADNIRFYFNAGSIIRLNVNIPTVNGNAKQNEWAALLNSKFFYINNKFSLFLIFFKKYLKQLNTIVSLIYNITICGVIILLFFGSLIILYSLYTNMYQEYAYIATIGLATFTALTILIFHFQSFHGQDDEPRQAAQARSW